MNKLYEVLLRKRLGKKKHRKLTKNAWYGALTNAMTLAYFAAALACFWRNWKQLTALAEGLGAVGMLQSGLALILFSAALMSTSRLLELLTKRVDSERLRSDGIHQRVYIGLKIFAILVYFALADSDAPAFVYEEF